MIEPLGREIFLVRHDCGIVGDLRLVHASEHVIDVRWRVLHLSGIGRHAAQPVSDGFGGPRRARGLIE